MARSELPLPSFYNPNNAAEWSYAPKHAGLLEAAPSWRKQHGIRPSGSDRFRLHLLLIDMQKDFCFPQGALYVAGRSGTGAIDDSARTAAFIYRNLDIISEITTTLDTHFAHQIFTPSFLVDTDGNPVPPMTMVPIDDVLSGKVKPNPMLASWLCNGNYPWLCQFLEHYTRELARMGKYTLIAWPIHCVLGSDGHPLVGIIQEARMFHSYVRGAQSNCEVKGGNPLSECYSVFGEEVRTRHDGKSLAQRNVRTIETLLKGDAVVVAGQADSHCRASSIDDLLNDILVKDPQLASKVYIMTDCGSSVVVPGIVDFTPQAEAAHQRFADAGMHLVKSTDPIESWPGMRLV